MEEKVRRGRLLSRSQRRASLSKRIAVPAFGTDTGFLSAGRTRVGEQTSAGFDGYALPKWSRTLRQRIRPLGMTLTVCTIHSSDSNGILKKCMKSGYFVINR